MHYPQMVHRQFTAYALFLNSLRTGSGCSD